LAEVLLPFRTRILATDMYPEDKPDKVEALWPPERLDELLVRADVLVLCVPLTDTTYHMIDARAISLMKPGALLINVARGPVVAETDLIAALESGRLAGAGVDVCEVEPLAADSRLWDLPNVLITPHVGAQSATRIDDATDLFTANLQRYRYGQPLWNTVDKTLGFPKRGFIWTPRRPAE
jgi:D-3-phosphoglycerate dehydrogenase